MLRQFGWISLVGFGLLASIAWYRFNSQPVATTFAAVAVLAPIIGMICPKLLKPLYVGLSLVTFPIGLVVSNLVLLLIFLLVFTPVALIFRLFGRDELRLRLDRTATTYWRKYDPDRRKPASYYRPF
ncbi:MAG: SxtJ family membrane protein [Akkermansiaceae bacterium]|nr:SxtJ family membrane protein [Akkermansiaceae bacterium]